jgi:hypothetical protein
MLVVPACACCTPYAAKAGAAAGGALLVCCAVTRRACMCCWCMGHKQCTCTAQGSPCTGWSSSTYHSTDKHWLCYAITVTYSAVLQACSLTQATLKLSCYGYTVTLSAVVDYARCCS